MVEKESALKLWIIFQSKQIFVIIPFLIEIMLASESSNFDIGLEGLHLEMNLSSSVCNLTGNFWKRSILRRLGMSEEIVRLW